jgi:predicted HicB family RNase H-like nuclease
MEMPETKLDKKTKKRLMVEISDDIHQQVKIRAAQRNIPMRLWVARAIVAAIQNEQQYE